MEETIEAPIPTVKIYNNIEITVGTLLGGPLVAGYLIAKNFTVFNERKKAKITWVIAILSTFLIFGAVLSIPDTVKIPNQLIPFIYTGIASWLVKIYQGQNITNHIASGGKLFSWWRTIVAGIIGLVITLIAVFGIIILSELATEPSVTTKTYGAMKHQIDFDKSNISDEEVEKLAAGFTLTGFFDQTTTKYVYAQKINNAYFLSISVMDGIQNDAEAIETFKELRKLLQMQFPNNQIYFKLVVEDLDNVVKLIE